MKEKGGTHIHKQHNYWSFHSKMKFYVLQYIVYIFSLFTFKKLIFLNINNIYITYLSLFIKDFGVGV